MEQVTAEQLKQHVKNNNVKRWKLRECGFCGTGLHYTFHEDCVTYDSNCDCTRGWSQPDIRGYDEPTRTLNMQQPDIREKMWNEIASGNKENVG